MLWLVPVLFTLFVAYFIGRRIGLSVPDEIRPSRKYLSLGMDVLLLLIVALTFLFIGETVIALCVVGALIVGRAFFPMRLSYAPLSGMVLGIAVSLADEAAITVLILTLLLNFLVGATTEHRGSLFRHALWQPVCALALWGIIALM